MKQPCDKHCPDRSAECHSTCERWLQYEAERNKQYDENKRISETLTILYEIERKRKADIATGRMRHRRSKVKR